MNVGTHIRFILCLIFFIPLTPGSGYSFTKLESDNFVFYYETIDAPLAQRLNIESRTFVTRICNLLNFDPTAKTEVFILSTHTKFDSLLANRVPDWGVGFANAENNVIYLKSPRLVKYLLPVEQIFQHEYVHIVLGQKINTGNIPRWFNEGTAMYFSGEMMPRDIFQITVATILDQHIPLTDLERSFPVHEKQAQLAYLESQLAVLLIIQNIRESGFQNLLDHYAQHRNFDYALLSYLGMERPLFYRYFERQLKSKYGWASLLNYATLWWGILSLFFVFVLIIKRIQLKQRLKVMEAAEIEQIKNDGIDKDNTSIEVNHINIDDDKK